MRFRLRTLLRLLFNPQAGSWEWHAAKAFWVLVFGGIFLAAALYFYFTQPPPAAGN
jgi:hypothetical protein